MRDVLPMGRGKRVSQRNRDVEEPIQRQRHQVGITCSSVALDQLHRHEPNAVGLLDGEDRDDVRVVERRHGVRFPFEAAEPLGVGSNRVAQDLDCDVAAELGSRARYTSPIPPAPSSAMISYGPRR